MVLTVYFGSIFVACLLTLMPFIRTMFGYWFNNIHCYFRPLFILIYYLMDLPRPLITENTSVLPFLHNNVLTYCMAVLAGLSCGFANVLLYYNIDLKLISDEDKATGSNAITISCQTALIIAGVGSIFAANQVK